MYNVIAGDTFELIARKVYGDDSKAQLLRTSNPGAVEPLTPGTTLATPADPNAPQNLQQPSDGGVALLLDGKLFKYWTAVSIKRPIDSLATATFSAPFSPESPEQREAFRPFSFKPVAVYVDDEPLFVGVVVGVTPDTVPDARTVTITAYSTCGVLNDCTAPASAYPIEFNGQTLQQIAATLAEPFGVSVEFLANPGAAFDRVALEPSRKVLDFLSELAQQRGLIITSSDRGALRFWDSSKALDAESMLREGSAPLVSLIPQFNEQDYYSHLTGITPISFGRKGVQHTTQNPATDTVRPYTFDLSDTTDADVRGAVESKAARMFASSVSYTATVATWRDSAGFLFEPNSFIYVEAPGAMIYNPFKFLIRSAEFTTDADSETATLELVLPGVFNGVIPEALPWDE